MQLFSIFLFAVSANLDNFVIGLSYGIKKIHIRFASNLIIGIITLIGTILSMSVGKYMVKFIPEFFAQIIGSVILIGLGTYCLLNYFIKKRRKHKDFEWPKDTPEQYDKDHSGTIEYREAITLGMALTLNNIGLGIGGSITGLSVILTSAVTFVIGLLSIYLGNLLGKSWLSKVMGSYAEPISGVIIIMLGIYEVFF